MGLNERAALIKKIEEFAWLDSHVFSDEPSPECSRPDFGRFCQGVL